MAEGTAHGLLLITAALPLLQPGASPQLLMGGDATFLLGKAEGFRARGPLGTRARTTRCTAHLPKVDT